jgi:hypothetical protein
MNLYLSDPKTATIKVVVANGDNFDTVVQLSGYKPEQMNFEMLDKLLLAKELLTKYISSFQKALS